MSKDVTLGVFVIPSPKKCTLADALIRRITLSAPRFRLVTYDQVRASPKKGRFRVLHPNESVSLLNRDILASDLIQRTRPVEGNIWMKSKEKPLSGGGAYTDVREHPRRGL